MLNGVDIASYQSTSATLYKGYAFVIVKATEGRTYVNPKWKTQIKNAINNGQLIGLYHYCRPENNSPAAEAKHFVDTIKEYVGKAVLAGDWEQTALKYSATWLLQFLQEVERLTGVKPVLYIQQSAISGGKYNAIAKSGYKLWMAQYNTRMSSSHGAWNEVTIWQYTSTGGTLDKNHFYGTKEDWLAMARTKESETESKGVDIVGNTKKGMKGVQVKGIQTMLNGYGYGPLAVDGSFGTKTLAAVLKFQRAEKLSVDGIVGQKTWNRLAGLS